MKHVLLSGYDNNIYIIKDTVVNETKIGLHQWIFQIIKSCFREKTKWNNEKVCFSTW
jgi:hypothetical protein